LKIDKSLKPINLIICPIEIHHQMTLFFGIPFFN